MNITIDCIPCVLNHVIHTVKTTVTDPKLQERCTRDMLAAVAALDWTNTPPDFARELNRILRGISGNDDLYLEEKDRSTELAHELLEQLQPDIAAQADPFAAAVRLAIAGNIIDYGVDAQFDLDSARGRIIEAFTLPIHEQAIALLKSRMDQAKSIFYVLDNCGEAVFDRLLVDFYRDKITLGVRGYPILNDVTPRELVPSGLGGLPYVCTGDATPGVSSRHSSDEFMAAMRAADLVIAKGQGNFETLNEYDRPIFFLFRAKCAIIIKFLGNVPMGSMQVLAANIS
ncbi:MAG: DUF89 family protein [Lentisphaerae bacterium]|nr:DUF89 family protein [Lentisphaerota bacterium]